MITRRIARLATLLLVLGLCVLAAPTPAQAATTLCKRSDYGCTTGGYQGKDPWGYWKYASSDSAGRLYNCTSYAAFKAAANGARNPGNLGNAVDWDANARRYGTRVDTSATVGSIAQFDSGSGHVAYVEAVEPGGITVTESSYGLNHTSRRFIPGNELGGVEFIHLADVSGGSTGGSTGGTTATSARIGVVNRNGLASVKEGSVGAGWTNLAGGITKMVLAGNRIVVLDSAGVASVKEGPLGAGWTRLADGVVDIAADGSRLGVVNRNGLASVKEGSVGAGWTNLAGGITKMVLTGNRILVLDSAGVASVKECPVNAGWTRLADGVADVAMQGARIAVVNRNGLASVKEGRVDAGWTNVADGVATASLGNG